MTERTPERLLQDAYDRLWAAVKARKDAELALDAARREHREAWDALDALLSELDPANV